MPSWYNTKIRFQKEDEAGALKTINESYLIDSVSFTDAEARAYKQIVTGASDFSVTGITRMLLSDIFTYEDGETWFKAKMVFHSLDERSGKEKKVVNQILVNADGIHQALERLEESLKQILIPYEIEALVTTSILDVFPYQSEEGGEDK